jgi:hypothetical protein
MPSATESEIPRTEHRCTLAIDIVQKVVAIFQSMLLILLIWSTPLVASL